MTSWTGIGVPKNTPPDIIDKLNKEINAGLADPRMRARIADLGGKVLGGNACRLWQAPHAIAHQSVDRYRNDSVTGRWQDHWEILKTRPLYQAPSVRLSFG
jgi:hypothetical protein